MSTVVLLVYDTAFVTALFYFIAFSRGYNACHLAAQHGHLDILRWLLSNKLVNPDEPGGHYGSTPVHEAAENGQVGTTFYFKDTFYI